MQVQAYLFFEGRCEEALNFYVERLGARIGMLMRFADAPDTGQPPPEGCGGPPPDRGKIMHAELQVGDSTLLVSDGMASGQPQFTGVSLALRVADATEAARRFAALGDGGQVQAPLGPTFFSAAFGMVTDRFGVNWMVVAEGAPAA